MPGSVFHALTATTPDNTSYEIRPSHWNSQHIVSLSLVGSEVIPAFGNANGVSFGLSAGSITGSVAFQGVGITVPGASSLVTAIGFSNANGISFGINGTQISASYTAPSTAGLISGVNVSASGSTQNISAFSFGNANGLTFGLSNGTITASYAQSSVSFANANNVSFGLNGGTLTASASYPAQTSLSFSNANGVTFGIAGATLTASVSQSLQTNFQNAVSLSGNTSGVQTIVSSGTLYLAGGNNITLSQSGNSVVVVGPNIVGVQTGISGIIANGSSASSGTVSFGNANGVTFGMNGQTITASVAAVAGAQTGISGVVVSNTTYTSGTLSFVNANGISFGSSGANGISASYTVPTQSNQTGAIYALNNTFGQAFSSTFDARSLSLYGSGEISVGWQNGSFVISTPIGNFDSMGVSNLGNTAGQTGLISQSMVFVGGNNITLSQATAAGGIGTMSIVGPNAQTGISGFAASNTTFSSGTISMLNANGISFGGSGVNGITASYTVPSVAGLVSGLNFSFNNSSTSQASGLTFLNSNGVSFGFSNGTVTASIPTQTAATGLSGFSVANTTYTSGTIGLQNANGISFGSSGPGGISASYTVPSTAGLISGINFSFNNSSTSQATGLTFLNSNGVTFGFSNGSITASIPNIGGAQTGISSIGVSNTTYTSGGVSFVNANGISFGSSGAGGISASMTQSLGLYALGNTTNNTTMTADARSLSIAGYGLITVGMSGGTLQISGPATTQLSAIYAAAAGTQTQTSGTLLFSNANGVSFGMGNNSVITASVNAGGQNQAFSASNGSSTFSTLSFGNSNGLSFYITNGSIVGSYTGGGGGNNLDISYGGNTTGTLALISAGTAVIAGGANITLSQNGNSMTIIGAAGGAAGSLGVYAFGNTTGNTSSSINAGSLSIVGGGIISVGLSNGSLMISGPNTTSYAPLSVGLSNIGNVLGNTGLASNQLVLVGSNNITLSGSTQNGSMTLSIFGGSSPVAIGGISVPGSLYSSGTVAFTNANGVSFGNSNGSITASFSTQAQSVQSIGLYGVGNTTQGSSGTIDARSLSIAGAGNVSVGFTNGSLVISGSATQSNQTLNGYAISNQTYNTSGSFDARSMSVAGSGIVSVGYTNGSLVVYATQAPQAFGMSNIGNTSGTTGLASNQLVLVGGNNITLSQSINGGSGTITISGPGGVAVAAGGSTVNAGTVNFSNANGVSFGMNASNITASFSQAAQTVQPVAVSGSNGSFAFSTLSFGNLNNVSFYTTNGSIAASVVGGTGGVAVAAGTQTQTSGTLSFGNANGISFGLSNSSVLTASYSQSAGTLGFYGISNTTGQSSSATIDARSLSIVGAGNISVGMSNGSLLISGTNPLATFSGIFAGTQSVTQGIAVFSNGGNVSFGMSNSSVITAAYSQTNQTLGMYAVGGNTSNNSSATFDARSFSINAQGPITAGFTNGSLQLSAPAITAVTTNFFWNPTPQGMCITNPGQLGHGSMAIFPAPQGDYISFSQAAVQVYMSVSTSSNSSAAGAISMFAGIYSRNGSTLSLATSGSVAYAFSNTSNNSLASLSGLRLMTIPLAANLTPGDYWIAFMSLTASSNANWFSNSNIMMGAYTLPLQGQIGQVLNSTNQGQPGFGVYSTSTNVLPASLGFSNIYGLGAVGMSAIPYIVMNNFSQ